MVNVLHEIPDLHFAVPLALTVNPQGIATISFQHAGNNVIQMQLTMNFDLTGIPSDFRGVINSSGRPMGITDPMGDLFIAPIGPAPLRIDFADDFHFSYTKDNMYLDLRIPVPPASKGDHSK